jgi:hypothetical protein
MVILKDMTVKDGTVVLPPTSRQPHLFLRVWWCLATDLNFIRRMKIGGTGEVES